MKARVFLVVVLLVVAGVLVQQGIASSRSALLVDDVCDAAQRREHDRVVAHVDADVAADDRDAFAGCMCASLVELGRAETCADLLVRVDAAVPQISTVADAVYGVFVARRDGARTRAAARAAVSAADEPPPAWIERALAADAELDEAYWRAAARTSLPVSIVVSSAALDAGNDRFALEVLGQEPPSSRGRLHEAWLRREMMAAVAVGGEPAGVAVLERRLAAGQPRAIAEADLTIATSAAMVGSPRADAARHYAWTHRSELDPGYRAIIAARVVQSLTVEKRLDELAAIIEVCAAEGIPTPLNKTQVQSLFSTNRDRRGTIAFAVDIDGIVLVSPDDKDPVDADWQRFAVKAGSTHTVERSVGDHPVRFVLRDSAGATRAVWQQWLVPGQTEKVTLSASSPWPSPATSPPPANAAADGSRRVVVFVADSADWRYLTLGFATGQLPVLESLTTRGTRSVMISDPPSTSVAMQRLTEPSPVDDDQMLRLRRLGSQADVALGLGGNPLDGLRLLSQSARPSLFDVIATKKRVLNLLFGHGTIKAGDDGLVGPTGHEPFKHRGRRPLRDDENVDIALYDAGVMREQLEQAAGQLDDLVEAIVAHRADLYLYRYDPTDMMAHNYLPTWNGNGPILRRSQFFSAYDYLDRRLGDVVAAMDADDVLLLLSDHGTQNSANHDRRAVFVAIGDGAVPHRVDGIRIEHVPSHLASLLCVQDPWKLPIVVGAIPAGCK